MRQPDFSMTILLTHNTDTNVVDLLFGAGEAVTQIAYERDGVRSFIEVKPSDIVTVTMRAPSN